MAKTKILLRWDRSTTKEGNAEWRLKREDGSTAAIVFDNGVWHTFDEDGHGGQNERCNRVDDAKTMALGACIEQGWIEGIELTL